MLITAYRLIDLTTVVAKFLAIDINVQKYKINPRKRKYREKKSNRY